MQPSTTRRACLGLADSALYAAKAQGRDDDVAADQIEQFEVVHDNGRQTRIG